MHPIGNARRNVHEIVCRHFDPIAVEHHHSAARDREDENPGLLLGRDRHRGPRLHDHVLEAQAVQHAREIENGVAAQLGCGAGQLREAAVRVARHDSPSSRARQPYAEGRCGAPKMGSPGRLCKPVGAKRLSWRLSQEPEAMLPARRLFGVVCAVVLPIAPAAAQGWIEHLRGAIEKVRSVVQVTVTGRAARVTVEEWFRNGGALLDEASYLYPLPGEAVFSDFSLWQGDRELKGEPMDAAQARAIYEEIVRRKRDPALIELAGHGLLRARVFPITPGETRKITLRYTQILDRTGDALRFRYAAGTAAASRSFRLQVDSAARVGDPYSPTHRLSASRSGDRLELALADTTSSGDLELLLPLTRGLVGMSLLTHQPVGEDGFFMLLLAPGRAAAAERLRRDVVAVLDVSGSMSGDKLDQAKAALVQLLGTLRSGDRFRVVTFASGVRRYAAGWTDVSADNIRAAQDWVRRVDTDGGTNIAGALTEALAERPGDGALGVVVFLTDGMPTVGETDPERIAEQADHGRGARSEERRVGKECRSRWSPYH